MATTAVAAVATLLKSEVSVAGMDFARRRRGRDDDGFLGIELRGLLRRLLLQRSSNTSCFCSTALSAMKTDLRYL